SERDESARRGFSGEKAALGLIEAEIMRRQPEGRKLPHHVCRAEDVMAQSMRACGCERSLNQHRVRRPRFENSGDVEELFPGCVLYVAPERMRALHQRHIGRMFEIRKPDDPALSMRGA